MDQIAADLPNVSAAGLSQEDREGLVNALKSRLQDVAGEHANVLEALTPIVRKRVEALRQLQHYTRSLIAEFENASGKKFPLVMAGRRPGDAEVVYASTKKAERELNWKAKFEIDEMCRDQWNWASKNPYGYDDSPDNAKN